MITAFLAGFFVFNAIPHLVQGISGKTHMTPFKRVSSPSLNVVWAFVNLFFGVLLLGFDPITGEVNHPAGANFWAFFIGGLIVSLVAAQLFGKPNARLPWHKD
ncbi:hypothetical protein A2783_02155 [Microgenomates group bacterium RIFCSPHIGHO2_01_FULL_45_11]|nr:MAG: hypothetical protein A2783_02155 [Microgenomates group bacterium RIFCSPHIGHO2_01_FULL_45_11]